MTQFQSQPWHVTRPTSVFDTKSNEEFNAVSPERSTIPGDIDLRVVFADLMANRGHNVFLRRAGDRRCGCWNTVLREAHIDCKFCTGTGWLYSDHLYKARKMPITDAVVAALLQSRIAIGLSGVPQFLWWLPYDAKPTLRDVILEVTLDEGTGLPKKPYKIESIWNIGQVQDYRDQGGRIEFWGCWVRKGGLGKE
jgi:hypothetical protein